jgi:opacity protein-like surface antigen
MKRLLLAAAATTFAIGSATAADMPVKAPMLKAPPPVYSWTGCYLDAGVGYGMYNQDESETAFGITTYTIRTADAVGSAGSAVAAIISSAVRAGSSVSLATTTP